MQVITSKDNEFVKEVKKLKEKKYRDVSNQFIVEGIKMVAEAINENADISSIIVCDECVNNGTLDNDFVSKISDFNCIYVTEKVFGVITDVTNPQGVLAVINQNKNNNQINYNEDFIIILDGIQDPGNLGTILRTIDSANLKQIIISNETADPYNPKVVRSTMGGIYRVKVVRSNDITETLKDLKQNGFEIVVTSLDTNNSIYDISYNKKAVVIGNEANGVSEVVQNQADKKVKIPMLGKTESLNAGVATGIMIYEYVRQKLNK